jgi:hypothetical protein
MATSVKVVARKTRYVERNKALLPRADLAGKLGGQRRIDVVELLDFADAIGFDPRDAIRRLRAVRAR